MWVKWTKDWHATKVGLIIRRLAAYDALADETIPRFGRQLWLTASTKVDIKSVQAAAHVYLYRDRDVTKNSDCALKFEGKHLNMKKINICL